MKKLLMLFAATSLLFAGCTSDDDTANVIKRDTNELSLAYANGSSGQLSVRYNGSWEASVATGCDWLLLSVGGSEAATSISSVGNGSDYQYLVMTANRNTGEARQTTVYLRQANSQEALEITVKQAAGIFEVSNPSLKGDIKQNVESSAYISIPYVKAIGGEVAVIETSLSGVADGLTIESPYTTVIQKEGDGQLSLPIEGTAMEMGALTINVKLSIDGTEIFSGTINASVVNDNFIWQFDFSKCIYGGDPMNNKKGVSQTGAQMVITEGIDWNKTDDLSEVSVGTSGTQDYFRGGAPTASNFEILEARNMTGWSGSCVYEHPGYIKMGTSAKAGWIQTPPMSQVSSLANPQDVVLSFDAAHWTQAKGTIYLEVIGAGTVAGFTQFDPPQYDGYSNAEWGSFTVTIKGAGPTTAFKWYTEDTDGNGRWMLDNIKLMGQGSIVERTEKLATPENVTATVDGTNITIDWNKVESADAYRVTIAAATQPDFVKSVDVTTNTLKVTRLQEGTTYNITVTAVYSADEKWNSETVELSAVTEGEIKIPTLTAPTVTLYEKSHGYAIIEWEYPAQALEEQALGTADIIDFQLKDAAGNVMEGRSLDSYNAFNFTRYKHQRFVFGGLTPNTKYRIEMRRRISADNLDKYLDSEWVGVDVTTNAAPDTSGYLFYADFEEFPYGCQPIACAYGSAIGSVNDYQASVALTIPGSLNYVYNPGRVTGNESWYKAYMPQWDYAEISANTTDGNAYNVALVVGALKFGGSSKPAHIWLPAVNANGDIILEIDSMPYYEPGTVANGASMQDNVAAENGITFHVAIVDGSGNIVETDGITVNTADAELTNTIAKDMFNGQGADANKRYETTHHTVKISGVTPETRIKVYTEGSANTPRMWVDKMSIKAAN
ncbi:MAG: fibronectin type III domain-containing protein [Alistipes sp.]|nr:fibronectin type III domain-containing protein [Alistipes sp.]